MITVSFGGCGSEKVEPVQGNNTDVLQGELQEKEEREQTVSEKEANTIVSEKENDDSGNSDDNQSEVVPEKTEDKEVVQEPAEEQSPNNEIAKEPVNEQPSDNEEKKNGNSKKRTSYKHIF